MRLIKSAKVSSIFFIIQCNSMILSYIFKIINRDYMTYRHFKVMLAACQVHHKSLLSVLCGDFSNISN